MNKLQAMEAFVQVVDAGSFTRAADNMQRPKATVSTQILALEQALAIKLLHRTTRQISVTAEGAAYYAHCQRILEDVRASEESLSHTRRSPSGRLRVDALSGLASAILIPAIPDFLRRYPDIELELGCSDRPADLIEESIDCAVRGGILEDSSLIARRVATLRFVTCAAPSYLAQHGQPTHPNDLQQHRCVNYFSSRTGKIADWDFARGRERIRVSMPRSISVNDSNAYVSAGLSGVGIVRMSTMMAGPMIARGQFTVLLPEWNAMPVPIHVVYPQNRHLSAKVRVFTDWVAELLRDHPHLRMPKALGQAPAARALLQEPAPCFQGYASLRRPHAPMAAAI